jgi:voltage-gated potassium channel Kch
MTGVAPLPGILLLYFTVPVRPASADVHLGFAVLLALIGVTMVALVIIREAKRLSQGDDHDITVVHLVALVEVAVVLFALAYYALSVHSQDEVSGIETRLDALYFSAVTTTTVGYGDIHPVGQLARGLATLQVSFDVVFVAALAGLIGRNLRGR